MSGEKCKMAAHPVYDREKVEAQAEAQAMADAEAAAVTVPADAPDLTRELVLVAADLDVMKVYVPEWGGFAHVRQLSGAERDRLETRIRNERGRAGPGLRAIFAAEVLCDAGGAKLFPNAEDVAVLAAKSARALDAVVEAAAGFNGLGGQDQETLRKN